MDENYYDTLDKAIAYINSHSKKQTGGLVDEVSKHVGYSRKQLDRIFIKVKGMSVAEYILLTKIDCALKSIILGLDVNISADNSNISRSSLLKGMKEQFGVRPKDIKKNNCIMSRNMGKIIAIGFSAGGAGASTLSLITGAFLAKNNKVLIIDASSIASTTYTLLGEKLRRPGQSKLVDLGLDNKMFCELVNCGLLGAMIDQDPKKYIINITNNFHILPNDGYLECSLPRLLYDKSLEKRIDEGSFKRMIEKLKSDYNYIIIDTPYPGSEIGDFVVRASDHILMPLRAMGHLVSRFGRTLELIEEKGLGKTQVTGVFRRGDDVGELGLAMEKEMKRKYGQIIFKSFLPDSENVGKAVYGYDSLEDEVNNYRVPCQYFALITAVCSRLAVI